MEYSLLLITLFKRGGEEHFVKWAQRKVADKNLVTLFKNLCIRGLFIYNLRASLSDVL